MFTSPASIRFFGLRCMGSVLSEDYVDWAISVLAEGHHSESVAILAGLPSPVDREDRERYFQKALSELGSAIPECKEVLPKYARLVAGEIARGVRDPIAGIQDMYWIASEFDDPPPELEVWLGLYYDLEYCAITDASMNPVIARIMETAKSSGNQ